MTRGTYLWCTSGGFTLHSTKLRHWLPLALALAILVAVGWALIRVTEPPAQAAPAAPAAPAATKKPPITDPAVQRWLWRRDKAQVELNDALVPLEAGKATTADCRRLDKAVKTFAQLGRAPHAEVDALIHVGQDKFAEAATVCLAGQSTAAYTLARQGLQERSVAYNKLDDVLEGD